MAVRWLRVPSALAWRCQMVVRCGRPLAVARPEAMLEGTRRAVAAANRSAGGDAARRFLLHVEVFHF